MEIGSRQDPEPRPLAGTPHDLDQVWDFPGELTPTAKRQLLGKVLEVAVRTTFSKHIYLFNNRLFQQQKGGPLGLRLTGVVACLVMDTWSTMFLRTLANSKLVVYLFRKYVDDINLALDLIAPGLGCSNSRRVGL